MIESTEGQGAAPNAQPGPTIFDRCRAWRSAFDAWLSHLSAPNVGAERGSLWLKLPEPAADRAGNAKLWRLHPPPLDETVTAIIAHPGWPSFVATADCLADATEAVRALLHRFELSIGHADALHKRLTLTPPLPSLSDYQEAVFLNAQLVGIDNLISNGALSGEEDQRERRAYWDDKLAHLKPTTNRAAVAAIIDDLLSSPRVPDRELRRLEQLHEREAAEALAAELDEILSRDQSMPRSRYERWRTLRIWGLRQFGRQTERGRETFDFQDSATARRMYPKDSLPSNLRWAMELLTATEELHAPAKAAGFDPAGLQPIHVLVRNLQNLLDGRIVDLEEAAADVDLIVAELITSDAGESSTAQRSREDQWRHIELKFEARVGQGNYADVWRATDNLNRRVAVKIIRVKAAERNIAFDHARLLARIQHNNVVTVHAFQKIAHPESGEGVDAVVMEYLDGETLLARLRGPLLTRAELLHIGESVIAGLEQIHSAGVAHGDLHENNIMLSGSAVKIIDIMHLDTLASVSTLSAHDRVARDVRALKSLLRQLLMHSELLPSTGTQFAKATHDATLSGVRRAFVAAAREGAANSGSVSQEAIAPSPISATPRAIDTVKTLLSDPRFRIQLSDLVADEVRKYRSLVSDELFSLLEPRAPDVAVRQEFVRRLQAYDSASLRLQEAITQVARWGQSDQLSLLSWTMRRVADPIEVQNGLTIWIGMRWFPPLLLLYSAGVAALASDNWKAIRELFGTLVADPRTGGSRLLVSAITEGMRDVDREDMFKTLPGHSQYHVPRSEYLLALLQPRLDGSLFLGSDYETFFDTLEALIALVVSDTERRDGKPGWGPPGRFVWKERRQSGPLRSLLAEMDRQGDSHPLLQAGLFAGSSKRLKEVGTAYLARIPELGRN